MVLAEHGHRRATVNVAEQDLQLGVIAGYRSGGIIGVIVVYICFTLVQEAIPSNHSTSLNLSEF
jgi:hypothetical protein